MKTVLIIGASGVVGQAATRQLAGAENTRIIRSSRSERPADAYGSWVRMDASDPADCARALAELPEVTHVVYCAIAEGVEASSNAEEVANVKLLRNVLEAVSSKAPNFRHICIVHGGKAYGVQFGQPRLPFKESDARYPESNFYYPQEQYLREASAHAAWKWTILRPPMVCGFVARSPMNALGVLGAFAAISRELGMPLRFPGGAPTMVEAVDADLLGEAIQWCGDEPRCGNEIFNVSNGDCFAWRNFWPRVADLFSMPVGLDYEVPLVRVMADKGEVWKRITERHALQPLSLNEVVPSWGFADFIFRQGNRAGSTLMSTIKIRQAGFTSCRDTEDMFIDKLRELQELKILPR